MDNNGDKKMDNFDERELISIDRAFKQVIAFKEEKVYLLNGNVSMICQKNSAKVRPFRAKLKELGVTK